VPAAWHSGTSRVHCGYRFIATANATSRPREIKSRLCVSSRPPFSNRLPDAGSDHMSDMSGGIFILYCFKDSAECAITRIMKYSFPRLLRSTISASSARPNRPEGPASSSRETRVMRYDCRDICHEQKVICEKVRLFI